MRSRSNSGVRLDGYARLVHETILRFQVSPDRQFKSTDSSVYALFFSCRGNMESYDLVDAPYIKFSLNLQ